MTFGRLLLRNLRFHWRAHLAVLLGVAVGTAVLTGALLVGDSLRGSLRERAEQHRAGVDLALVSNRFFTATPASRAGQWQAGLVLRGSLRAGTEELPRRLNGVTVLSGLFGLDQFVGTALPASLARQLNVGTGDPITLRIPVQAAIPSESLLGQREFEQTSTELTLTVGSILPD